MSEQRPNLDRIIASPERAEEIRAVTLAHFLSQEAPKLVEGEREKTAEELAIIALANEATDALRVKHGADPVEMPAKNIHVVRADEWSRDTRGEYEAKLQGAVMAENPTRLGTAATVFHEMAHFKSFFSLEDTGKGLHERRVGLEMGVGLNRRPRFTELNEAVTEELTARFLEANRTHPLFAAETERHESHKELLDGVRNAEGHAMIPKDAYGSRIHQVDGEFVVDNEVPSYPIERRALNTLIDKLHEKNEADFKDREEIFDLFAKAMFTGKLLVLSRLLEKTFGKGTLKKIAETQLDAEGFEELIDKL